MDNWEPNDFIDKITIRPQPVELPRVFNLSSVESVTPVTDDQLQDAYRTMAEIVSLHGATYLPIFARLHRELENKQGEKAMLGIAEQVAGFEPKG